MNAFDEDEPFYIGYLPKAPPPLARFVGRMVAAISGAAMGVALVSAAVLPYFGTGAFDFGRPQTFVGSIRCELAAPRLAVRDADYLLVGYGKNGVPLEICGASNTEVTLRGTLIQRDGRRAIEVTTGPSTGTPAPPAAPPVSLGRFTLTGEIVDSKCYFGVMNPAEGRAHRACAELCLRGGVPAVFVVHDRAGRRAQLLIADASGKSLNARLLPWVGEAVELSGEVMRQGKWLVLHLDLDALHFAAR